MDKPYFVMMYSQDGKTAMVITDGENEYDDNAVKFWATEKEAREAMNKHPYASKLGYEVFSMDESL